MNAARRNLPLFAVLGLIAVIVAVGAAVAISSDDGKPVPAPPPTTTATVAPPPTTPTQAQTVQTQVDTIETQPRDPERSADTAAVQKTVTALITAAEESDAAGVCRAVGASPRGSGLRAAQACAQTVGVDLSALPTSDELSFDDVVVRADSRNATATLVGGTSFGLRESGGRWNIVRARIGSPPPP